ncbi:MAG TPA: hypothetical protein V6C71_15135 [Coleofasciculaceae cyanobacterium]|jgi:hypothetical protein
MTEQKPDRPIDFRDAKQPSDIMKREAQKESSADAAQMEQKFTPEQSAEDKLAHEQNITAHIPGGGMIADLDK